MAAEDYFDPYSYPDDEDEFAGSGNIECKRCGKSGLRWEDVEGKWVLYNSKGVKHVCKPLKFDLHKMVI